MSRCLRRLRARLRYWRFERDVAEEIRFHHAMKQDEWERTGVPHPEARQMANRDMGNLTRAREASRAIWIASWLESLGQDLSYAVRSLRRQPGYALTAVTALVLGIGVNTSAFTYFKAVALRPWAVPDPARVVQVHQILRPSDGERRVRSAGFSLAEYRHLRDRTKTFAGMIAWRDASVRLGHEEIGRGSAFGLVSANYFDVLGVEMIRGRGFLPDEDHPETPHAVVVISHRLWTRQFASDPAILDRTIRLDDVPFVVVGVAPPGFVGTESIPGQALWMPTASLTLLRPGDRDADDMWRKPTYCCSYVAGRLAPGATREQAHAELRVLIRAFRAESPGPWDFHEVMLVSTTWIAEPGMRHILVPMFGLMFAAVALVLLLACANVGNLMLARGLARQREIGIRLSLGASRARVVRQLLTEALVVAALAGGAAVAVAYVLPAAFFRAAGPDMDIRIAPDASVLAFALGISLIACLIFGLLPALRSTRAPGIHAGRHLEIRHRSRLRGLLLAAQLALGVVLLAGAALLVRGVSEARGEDSGLRVDEVSVASLAFPRQAYDDARARAFFAQLLDTLHAETELRRVALTRLLPLGHVRNLVGFGLPEDDDARDRPSMQVENVSAGYFDVLRIPIVAGRAFQPRDDGRLVVIVNEAFARRYLPGTNPVGRRIRVGNSVKEIVGVAKNSYTSWDREIAPLFYELYDGGLSARLLLRPSSPGARTSIAGASDAAVLQRVKAIVQRLDSRVLIDMKPLAFYRDRWLGPSRVLAATASAVGLLALVLACVGVFGVFAYVVQERRREIGIRMAIGAQSGQVVRLVLGTTAWATLGGLVLGLAGAAAFSRFLRGYLYGVGPFDPLAYGSVAIVLAIAAVVATYVPVRRATRVDPTTALRCE